MLRIPSNSNLLEPYKFAREVAKHDFLDEFDKSWDVKQILCVCHGKIMTWKSKSVSVDLFY